MAVIFLALKSLLIAAATLLLLRLMRSRSAAERSTVAHLGLLALVALPFAGAVLPALPLPLPTSVTMHLAEPAADAGTLSPSTPTSATAHAAQAHRTPTSIDAASAVARLLYLLPTLALLALTLAALWRLAGLRARAEVLVDPLWLTALARAQRRMDFKSGTALLKSRDLGSPVSWGLLRPTILLDEAAALAPEQAEAIIAHELAHVVHLDWVKLILARIATAMFWFNPLAWVLTREAHQLREEAADDAVIAANIAGPEYAGLLVGMARHPSRGTLGALGIAAPKSALHRRVQRILDSGLRRAPSGRWWIAGCAVGMLAIAGPLAAIAVTPETVRATASATPPHEGDRIDADTLVRMLSAGVTPEYQRAMTGAGFPQLSVDQLIGAHTDSITPDYARAMLAMGMPASYNDLMGARGLGLEPGYIATMRQLGIAGSFEDFRTLWSIGIRPDTVRRLKKRGVIVTSPRQLIDLDSVGAVPKP